MVKDRVLISSDHPSGNRAQGLQITMDYLSFEPVPSRCTHGDGPFCGDERYLDPLQDVGVAKGLRSDSWNGPWDLP